MGLLRRRGLLAEASGGGGDISDYVQSGLILWLDGIQNTASGHNASATQWEDLSGKGHNYPYHASNVINDTYLAVNSRGAKLTTNWSMAERNAMSAGGTIEIVLSQSSSKVAVIIPITNVVGTTATAAGGVLYFSSNANAKKSLSAPIGEKHYYNSALWRDGVQQANTNVSDTWSSAGSIGWLFSYAAANSYGFNGNVYAIRVYNRTLTDAEMMNNWLLDKARFNI